MQYGSFSGLIRIFAFCVLGILLTQNAYAVEIRKDIAYGSHTLQKLDVYLPKGSNAPSPILFYIHGGAWAIGDKKRSRGIGKFYSKRGVIVISVNYRLSPKFSHPAHVEDVAKALKWTFDHASEWGADTRQIHVSGHSAGGHLAALVATDPSYLAKYSLTPSQLASVMPNDIGAYDLEKRMQSGDGLRIMRKLITNAFGKDAAGLRAASPIYHVSQNVKRPPFTLFVSGEREDAASQTLSFMQALRAAGTDAEMVVVPDTSHKRMQDDMSIKNTAISDKILHNIIGN